jgi:hypothetical protein
LTPLAAYGAVTATFALLWGVGWSVYTWRREHATRVHVTLEVVRYRDTPSRDHTYISYLVTTVTNRSAHPVRITRFDVDRPRLVLGRRHYVWMHQEQLPHVIPSQDSHEILLRVSQLEIRRPEVVAAVQLSTGEVCRSNAIRLDAVDLEQAKTARHS